MSDARLQLLTHPPKATLSLCTSPIVPALHLHYNWLPVGHRVQTGYSIQDTDSNGIMHGHHEPTSTMGDNDGDGLKGP